MAYRPALTVKVEALGGVFWFGAADQAMARIAGLGMASFDTVAPPAEMIAPLCELAVEGIRDWEGVEDERGRAISCTPATVRELPPLDKVQIAAAYLELALGIAEKRGPAEGPPIDSTRARGTEEAATAVPENGNDGG